MADQIITDINEIDSTLDPVTEEHGLEMLGNVRDQPVALRRFSRSIFRIGEILKSLGDRLDGAFKTSDCYYSIDDYWITESSQNPATKWIGTVWIKLEGRMLFGSDENIYSVGQEGGVTQVSLSIDNIPSHRHLVDSHIHSQVDHKHIGSWGEAASWFGGYWGNDGSKNQRGSHSSDGDNTRYYTSPAGGDSTGAASPYTDYQGNGTAFNVLNAYRVVNIWRRTA